MNKIIAAFFLIFISLQSYSQDTLPNFNVFILSPDNIQISWNNPFEGCNQIAVQRSYDSTRFFKTIFSPQSPELPQNGFVDNTPAPGMKVYYRLFYVLSGGSYFFTKSKQPRPAPANSKQVFKKAEPDHYKYPSNSKVNLNKEWFTETESLFKAPQLLPDDIETEELVYVHWVSIYKKSKDSLIKTMDIDFYKKYKDSIKLKTKDTLVNIGIDEYLIKPFVPKPVWKASAYLYTNTDGYTILKVPEFGKHQYKVIFKEENGTDIFTLHKVLDSYLLIDKSNFPHAGWFFYEMYQDDVLFEKNKFFIESDF